MNAEKVAHNAWWTLLEHLKMVAAAISAIAVVSGALFWVFSPHLESMARDVAGTNEVIGAVNGLAEEQMEQRVILEGVVLRVDRLEPAPQIVEYDELRSYIDPVCALGEACHWEYLTRRTPYGENCMAPSSERQIRDFAGITHYPERVGPANLRRLDREWTRLGATFVVPESAALGPAEFYLSLVYSGCGPDRNQTYSDQSLPLVFTIVENPDDSDP